MPNLKVRSKIITGLVFVIVVGVYVSPSVYAALMSNTTVSTTGVIVYTGGNGGDGSLIIEAFSDTDCTQPLVTIDWGTLAPGESVDRVVFVKNTGTNSVVLAITYGNFTPPSASSLSITSDYNSAWILDPNEVLDITLTLSVSSTMTDADFGFDVTIQALESPSA